MNSSTPSPSTLPRVPTSLVPDPEILKRNLDAIAVRSPKAAARIRSVTDSTELDFALAPTGELIATLDGRALCSKRDPIREAITWAEQYDPQRCGFLGILGFGLGHHLRALHAEHSNNSVFLCFEPDVAMLRAVLQRVDHSAWISTSVFLLATDPSDTTALTQLIQNTEALITTGVELAPHPPSQRRLSDTANEFSSTLLGVVRTTRTHLVTVLMHSGITLRNILMHAGPYAHSAGITALKDSCKGRTAILIAAGPSLQRNLHLLQDPTIRERFVIITVQTMLKPLLERGIKPHFVTALDHHEISKRFYEGLTAEDVQGVRLVVEPKANAAITTTFPGETLFTSEAQLDMFLGEGLARDMGALPAGATVAHLNYYLARYLGCTTTILIGQDLGFTDGQYYASGASTHSVWAGELSEHRTLEMFEWERIMRMKSLLRIKTDIHGRHIFTDEQMSTYIAQFEKDFYEDTTHDDHTRRIRVINATEGGVNIQHTEAMPLARAISECTDRSPIALPETAHLAIHDEQRDFRIRSRMELVIRQLNAIERDSQRALDIIAKAQSLPDDMDHFNQCVSKLHAIRNDVTANEPGYGLVNFINQRGALARFKVDRQIGFLKDLTDAQRQIKKLDRDANNVHWIKESAAQVRKLVERSLSVFSGTARPMTRDEFADESQIQSGVTITEPTESPRRVEAVIFADPELGPLGQPRDLSRPIHQGLNALELTVRRLARAQQLDGITIITPNPERINAMHLNADPKSVRVVACDPEVFHARTRAVGQARIASSECWRGSIASLGCYDESLDPAALFRVMDEHRIDTAAIVGSDWAMVDPELIDTIVARHRADPDHCRVPFSQAVPGLGCCLLDRDAAETLASAASKSSVHGSIGAMLSYIPIGPQGDPIASPLCVGIDPLFRDAGIRVIADSTLRAQAMSAAYAGLGEFSMAASATVLLKAYATELAKRESHAPSRIQIELTTARPATALWGAMHHQPLDQRFLPAPDAIDLITQAVSLRDDCTLLIHGRGDPLAHPDLLTIIKHAKQVGIASIELRTDLINTPIALEALINAGIDVLSVDIPADTTATYTRMTGINAHDTILDQMQTLFNTRTRLPGQFPTPWIVPRITRCDEVYDDLRAFYDRWINICGCAIIDPNPTPTPDQRIQPLAIPARRADQLNNRTLRIQVDGQIIDHNQTPIGVLNAIDQGIESTYHAMRRTMDHTSNASIEAKATPQIAGTR